MLLAKLKIMTAEGSYATGMPFKQLGIKKGHTLVTFLWWELRGSNPRPPRCKRGALNQLS